MTEQTDPPFDPAVPFLRREALAAGISGDELKGPRFRRLFHGVFVSSTAVPTDRLRTRAALTAHCDEAWASHVSAARVVGAPVPTIGTEHVSVPHQSKRRHLRGIRCHVGDPTEVRVVDGMRISGPTQMFVELAGQLSLVDLVVVGDWLVRRTPLTSRKLLEACRTSRHRDARKALAAAHHVRERVDSPMETRLRMLLVLGGLPEPEINVTVRDADGEVIRKYDLSYGAIKVAVEYNGTVHVETIEQWEHDLERRADMDEEEWRLVVVVSAGIYRRPEQTLRRVWRVLHARGLAGVPVRIADDWRIHFPGHDDVA